MSISPRRANQLLQLEHDSLDTPCVRIFKFSGRPMRSARIRPSATPEPAADGLQGLKVLQTLRPRPVRTDHRRQLVLPALFIKSYLASVSFPRNRLTFRLLYLRPLIHCNHFCIIDVELGSCRATKEAMNRPDQAAVLEGQLRVQARLMALRNDRQLAPEHFAALRDLCCNKITAENCPNGRVLSVLNLEFAEHVDVSDGTTAPGKLFKASMEYICTIAGFIDMKWAREGQNVCVLVLWDSPLSWRSFQESVGFTRMAPLVTRHIVNRSVLLPQAQVSAADKKARFLWPMEIIFQADLDSHARSQFEGQVSAILGDVGKDACHGLVSGWIEHDFPASRLPIQEADLPIRTECIYIIFYESTEDDNVEISKLRELLDHVSASPDVKKKCNIGPRMAFQDIHEQSPVEPAPVQPQVGTLAGALQRGIRRSAVNEKMEVASAHLAEYRCYPSDPHTVSQVGLYKRLNLQYMALWRLGSRPNDVPALQEPYMVDIAWLKTRSSLDMIKRRVGKMLNYRIRQLIGYHSGFWVRVADSAHEFGVCTGIFTHGNQLITGC